MRDGYEKHREVVRLYDVEAMTFAEIGEILNISKQRVHQIYHDAMIKHKTAMRPLPMRPSPRVFTEKSYDWAKIKRDIDATLRGKCK